MSDIRELRVNVTLQDVLNLIRELGLGTTLGSIIDAMDFLRIRIHPADWDGMSRHRAEPNDSKRGDLDMRLSSPEVALRGGCPDDKGAIFEGGASDDAHEIGYDSADYSHYTDDTSMDLTGVFIRRLVGSCENEEMDILPNVSPPSTRRNSISNGGVLNVLDSAVPPDGTVHPSLHDGEYGESSNEASTGSSIFTIVGLPSEEHNAQTPGSTVQPDLSRSGNMSGASSLSPSPGYFEVESNVSTSSPADVACECLYRRTGGFNTDSCSVHGSPTGSVHVSEHPLSSSNVPNENDFRETSQDEISSTEAPSIWYCVLEGRNVGVVCRQSDAEALVSDHEGGIFYTMPTYDDAKMVFLNRWVAGEVRSDDGGIVGVSIPDATMRGRVD